MDAQAGNHEHDKQNLASLPISHDRRMAAVNQEGVEIKVEIRSLPNAIRRSNRGTPFLPITGKMLSGPDAGASKDIELWDKVAQNFLEATKFTKPSGDAPLIVTFRGRARMKQSYNAANDSRTQKWPFNAKEFDLDFVNSPAAKRPVAANQAFLVLGLERRVLQSSGQTISMLLVRTPERSTPMYRFALPAGKQQDETVFARATPANPISAVFQGEWRMRPHKDSFAPVFSAKACLSIDGAQKLHEPAAKAAKSLDEARSL